MCVYRVLIIASQAKYATWGRWVARRALLTGDRQIPVRSIVQDQFSLRRAGIWRSLVSEGINAIALLDMAHLSVFHYNRRIMRPLHQCLLDTDLTHLQAIARFWDVDLAVNRQQEAAAQLAEAMSAPPTIADTWDALPDDQRQAMSRLLAAGGRMPLFVFARRWGEVRAMGPGKLDREQPWRQPISPAEGLWYKGFLFHAFDMEAEETYQAVFIPPELRAHLPAPPTPPPAIALEPAPEPTAARSAGDILLDDACTLLAYLQNVQVRPNSDGDWPARHQTHLAQRRGRHSIPPSGPACKFLLLRLLIVLLMLPLLL